MAKSKKSTKVKVSKKGGGKGEKPVAPKTAEAPRNTEPKVRDERLPAVGTKLEKRDRAGAVRCHCEVVEGGIRYAGTTYKSISAAAMAAAKDLGLKNRTQNGYVFFGLSKPPRPVSDPVEALRVAAKRFLERAEKLVANAGEAKDAVVDEVKQFINDLQNADGMDALREG